MMRRICPAVGGSVPRPAFEASGFICPQIDGVLEAEGTSSCGLAWLEGLSSAEGREARNTAEDLPSQKLRWSKG